MFYTIQDFVVTLVSNLETTVSGLLSAIGNPNYSLGEWVYDTIETWTTW